MYRYVIILVALCFAILILDAEGLDLPLQPGDQGTLVVKRAPVTDCRVVRGFLGTPVDGSIYSWDYRGTVREYPRTASDGVAYSYNNNDGLHITLGDDRGFDAVVLRGGARARMYVDLKGTLWETLVEPAEMKPVWEFHGGDQLQFAHFSKTVTAREVSFFGVQDGLISDVGFYRIEGVKTKPEGLELWTVRESPVHLPEPESEFAPESLYPAMNERYAEGERYARSLERGEGSTSPVQFKAGQAVHFITPPFDEERGISAVCLEMDVSSAPEPFSLTAMVQDPLDPRLDLTWIPLSAEGPGRYSVMLDIPDQVLLKGSQLWLTLRFDKDLELSSPEFWLSFVTREKALPEALARRKLLLKSFFSLLSEPRPWGAYSKQPREEFYASSRYAKQCPELFMTIDQCHALDPADDVVRQYREWVYLRNLDELSQIPPLPDPPEGVPAWAWYPRLAWLEVRCIADWWIRERAVPTGEFGGRVGDDSDLYQQFTDLPFFETGGVAAELMDNAARMAELADKENLRGGLNIHATDSLHAYEEGINHLALMARWFYGDPIYMERCMESARNMEALTILTDDGRRHFRDSQRMGAEDMEHPREPKVDGHTDPLMWHTAFQAADYNRNPRTLKILREWADTWLRFMKPDQWATEVEVLSGKATGFQKDRPLYGGYSTQAATFTWLYGLTGDGGYLEPFLYYYRQGKAPHPANGFLGDAYTLGALNDLDQNTLDSLAGRSSTLAIYLNGDTNPLMQAAIGDPRGQNQGIGTLFDALRWHNMYTTSHQFTDRIFPDLLQHASISYLGGFCRRNKFNPTLAVSWEGFGIDYAALVLLNRQVRIKALVYSFASKPMKGNMRVWSLKHGMYQLNVGQDTNGNRIIDAVEAEVNKAVELMKGDAIELTLPPRTVTLVDIRQVEELDPIFSRADLAVAARETDVNGRTVTGVVHNIGSSDAPDVIIAVVDAEGRTVIHKSIGSLSAPVDLIPRRLPFTLQLPDEPKKGWRLVVDPEQNIPEIYEGNNQVAFDDLPVAGLK